jgi:RsmE family RNA methyltransferase
MNLLLLEPEEIDREARAVVGGARASHVASVLRLAAGDLLAAGIVDGPRGRARVVEVTRERLVLDVSELREQPTPARQGIDLLLALPRPKVLKRLFAPLACLGVDRVMLTNAARVERFYFDTHVLDPSFVRERLIEGLSQARDTRLPRVSIHRSFRRLVEDELAIEAGTRSVLADERLAEAGPSLRSVLRDGGPADRLLIAVGPEGGWVDFERQLLEGRGLVGFRLGERTLRSDLACLLAVGLGRDFLSEPS